VATGGFSTAQKQRKESGVSPYLAQTADASNSNDLVVSLSQVLNGNGSRNKKMSRSKLSLKIPNESGYLPTMGSQIFNEAAVIYSKGATVTQRNSLGPQKSNVVVSKTNNVDSQRVSEGYSRNILVASTQHDSLLPEIKGGMTDFRQDPSVQSLLLSSSMPTASQINAKIVAKKDFSVGFREEKSHSKERNAMKQTDTSLFSSQRPMSRYHSTSHVNINDTSLFLQE